MASSYAPERSALSPKPSLTTSLKSSRRRYGSAPWSKPAKFSVNFDDIIFHSPSRQSRSAVAFYCFITCDYLVCRCLCGTVGIVNTLHVSCIGNRITVSIFLPLLQTRNYIVAVVSSNQKRFRQIQDVEAELRPKSAAAFTATEQTMQRRQCRKESILRLAIDAAYEFGQHRLTVYSLALGSNRCGL